METRPRPATSRSGDLASPASILITSRPSHREPLRRPRKQLLADETMLAEPRALDVSAPVPSGLKRQGVPGAAGCQPISLGSTDRGRTMLGWS